MRLILRFTIPVEKGNEAAVDGFLAVAIDSMVKQLKPEAAYFHLDDGRRAGWFSNGCYKRAAIRPTKRQYRYSARYIFGRTSWQTLTQNIGVTEPVVATAHYRALNPTKTGHHLGRWSFRQVTI